MSVTPEPQEPALETLVQAVAGACAPAGPAGRVLELAAARPISVAEVSARLGVPFGQARDLVTDLAAAGLLRIDPPAAAGRPDPQVLARLLAGLRGPHPSA